ncbi:MAG: PhaM family polyhydroxyalkanoate granule multifunctional regulatory protein [Massilia sp.]
MSNPFPNMPGAGAMTDSLEFVKNLWGSMGVPGMAVPGITAPPMSIDDLDKKIADLKAVEAWLNVNGAMLRATIQGLEVQRGTLATLKSMGASFADAMKQATPDAAKSSAGAAPAMPMMPDPTVWWNVLQEQFKQAVASAVPPAGSFSAPGDGAAAPAKAAPAATDPGEAAPARGAKAKPAKN